MRSRRGGIPAVLLAVALASVVSGVSAQAVHPLEQDPRYLANKAKMEERVRRGEQPLIIGGDRTTGFPEVVAILGAGQICTGTLVTRTQVLTAAHCVCMGITERVIFGASIKDREYETRVARRERMGACPQDPGRDIALLWLEAEPPPKFAPREIVDLASLSSKESIHVVGHGKTEIGSGGEKFRADLAITSHRCDQKPPNFPPDPELYGCAPTAELVAAKTELKKDTCVGDSGGPVHLRGVGRDGLGLVGVTSRPVRGAPKEKCGAGGVYVLLDGPRLEFLVRNGVPPPR